jgi:signal transduction histidine kinase
LTELIDQTLNLVQLNSGLVEMQFEEVDLRDVLREVVLAHRGAGGSVHLSLEPEERPAPCNADGPMLRQVFRHLLANATKFSPEGSGVLVRLIASPKGHEVSVRDRGPGVPPGIREAVFEPFVQCENVLVDKPPGLGLGLAIARKVLQLHGASVSCGEAPDGGAVFSVILPAADASASVPR